MAIHLKNIYLTYDKQVVFANLNWNIASGKWTSLLGPNGIGKSTLLKLIAHLIPTQTPGEIFKGQIYSDNAIPLHEKIAYMAQTDLLLPWLNILDNVLIGHRLRGPITADMINEAKTLLIRVGLAGVEEKFPYQLSGGMRQRAALARTLLENKPIILMDEPFSAVDAITRFELQTLAAELLKNRTVLLVTHDPLEALRLANDIYILSGQPAELKHIVELNNATPRNMNDPNIMHYQNLLFSELTAATRTTE